MNSKTGTTRAGRGIGELFRLSLKMWGKRGPRRLAFFLAAAWRMKRADSRRRRSMRLLQAPVPYVVAISPTMRCNYRCTGCYSRGRGTENELTVPELNALFTEAEELGILAILVTGGEPLLRPRLLELIAGHRRLFFVLITNGSLLSSRTARLIGRTSNMVTLVSIDGDERLHDQSRECGSYAAARRALELLRGANAFFGFAATVTAVNAAYLGSESFIDEMIGFGCAAGYFTEYVPCGETVCGGWLLDAQTRNRFRERVLELRGTKPIVLVQFPHDEYGDENLCSAAGRYSLHIGPGGNVEPCPFVPISRENVRNGGLVAAVRSPLLRAIRSNPALLRRDRYACALFEHRQQVSDLATSLASHKPPLQNRP